jgi:hypothetical protein
MELGRTKVGKVRSRQMKLHRFKRILKKDELLTIEAYANDKVNAVLEQIRNEIEALEYLKIEDGSDGYDKYIEQYEVLKIIDNYR